MAWIHIPPPSIVNNCSVRCIDTNLLLFSSKYFLIPAVPTGSRVGVWLHEKSNDSIDSCMSGISFQGEANVLDIHFSKKGEIPIYFLAFEKTIALFYRVKLELRLWNFGGETFSFGNSEVACCCTLSSLTTKIHSSKSFVPYIACYSFLLGGRHFHSVDYSQMEKYKRRTEFRTFHKLQVTHWEARVQVQVEAINLLND